MPLPFTSQGFVMKALDQPQSRCARNPDNILPFFVALVHFGWESRQTSRDPAVFIDLECPRLLNVESVENRINSNECIKVGHWTLDPATSLLERHGQQIHLEPRLTELHRRGLDRAR